ncbi:uncharacterized protein V6R79_007106 [Siganus canaliculatus]
MRSCCADPFLAVGAHRRRDVVCGKDVTGLLLGEVLTVTYPPKDGETQTDGFKDFILNLHKPT